MTTTSPLKRSTLFRVWMLTLVAELSFVMRSHSIGPFYRGYKSYYVECCFRELLRVSEFEVEIGCYYFCRALAEFDFYSLEGDLTGLRFYYLQMASNNYRALT
jgi:hypothetical protein